jgi:hypothetical protein
MWIKSKDSGKGYQSKGNTMKERTKELADTVGAVYPTLFLGRHDGVVFTETELETFVELVAAAEAAKWTKGAKISIPTETMEQEFSVYHYRGYEAGKALIPAAVAAEREACAKLCEAQGEYGDEQYAAAIRARSQT